MNALGVGEDPSAPGPVQPAGAFRTDGGDESLPWFEIKPGEFPPPGSAHAIAGELIACDHVNRAGKLRYDRDSSQRTDHYDRAYDFAMLPYGRIIHQGSPAELRDIPIGTHLHGEFYKDASPPRDGKFNFPHAIKLEDDFSYFKNRGRLWRVDHIDPHKNFLSVTGIGGDKPDDPAPTKFQLSPATRVWLGKGLATLAELQPGQQVLLNLTVCTLKGPGRCTDIWIDQESRELATARQREVHKLYQQEHGLAAIVDEVDNKAGTVTATLFDGFDPSLVEHFREKESIGAAVSEANLRTYDQINDNKHGQIVEVTRGETSPGNSGIRVRFKPEILLEGFRPKRIIRLFWGGWRIDDLPREERLYD